MRRKIIILVMASVLVSLASLGLLSYLIVRDSVNRSFEDHVLMASMLAREIDYNIEVNISRLLDIYISGQVDPSKLNELEAKQALRTVYKYSMFSDGVFLVGRHGDVLLNYPYRSSELGNALNVPTIDKALYDGNIVVSDVYTDNRTGRKFIYVIVPLKAHDGSLAGALGGRIDPTNYVFSQVIRDAASEKEVIELVDSRGAVIASNQMDRVLTMSDHNRFMEGLVAAGKTDIVRCHRCHEGTGPDKPLRADILAFSPLSTAPWGVAIRMPEEAAYRPTVGLVRAILAIGVVLIVSALFLAAGLSRSIADPVRLLTDATRKIASGELERPVLVDGEDEIGELASSLETMRRKLDMLVRESQRYSHVLEQEVAERTHEVVLSKKQLASLLDELIAAQEDERKRIAQELHDDTAQTIAALGMSIDIAVHALDNHSLTPTMLMELREKVSDLLDDIGRIIKNLRPSVLDDLGLESAIEWMLDRQLKPRGIGFFIDAEGIGPGTFNKQSELSVFRIMQEALNNVVKHSEATHVSVIIKRKGGEVKIEVVDDGVGYDMQEARRNHGAGGFGLVGIRERVQQLGGEMEIVSAKGEGTGLYISVPALEQDVEVADGKD